MKKYVTIKMELEDAKHLKKWIENSLKIAESIRPENENNKWFKKMLEIIKSQLKN